MIVKPDRVKVISEMAQKEITCKELIEVTGLSPLTVTNIRKGKKCNFLTLKSIASALGVPVENILEG